MTVDRARPPLYAQTLRLRHTQPGAAACCVLFEGSMVMGGLLSLSELAGSWALAGMPITVAALVKVTDAAFGALTTGPTLASGLAAGDGTAPPAWIRPWRRGFRRLNEGRRPRPDRRSAAAGALYRRVSEGSFEVERVSDIGLQPGHVRQLDYAQHRRSGVWDSSTCPRGNVRPARMEVCEEAPGARGVPNQGSFEA